MEKVKTRKKLRETLLGIAVYESGQVIPIKFRRINGYIFLYAYTGLKKVQSFTRYPQYRLFDDSTNDLAQKARLEYESKLTTILNKINNNDEVEVLAIIFTTDTQKKMWVIVKEENKCYAISESNDIITSEKRTRYRRVKKALAEISLVLEKN